MPITHDALDPPSAQRLPMRVVELSPAARYAVAVGAAAAGVLLRLAVGPEWADRIPFIVAFPAIALSSWVGGFGPGMLTTLLSAGATAYFWLGPSSTRGGMHPEDAIALLAFVAVGAVISTLNLAWRRGAARELQMRRERAALLVKEQQTRADAEAAVQHLQIALDAGRMGTWEWTLANGRVKWSAGLEAIHGVPPGSFPGTFDAFQNEIHPDDRTRVLEAIRDAVEQRREHQIEYRIVRGDGTVRWVEGRGNLITGENGRPERLVGVCVDTTDRKLAEESHREAKRLAEEANRMKDRFLAVLSHELRTPLQALVNYAHVLSEESLPRERVNHAVAAIQRSAHAQARLIESLLDLARIESGKLDLKADRIDLLSVVEAAVDMVRSAAHDKCLTLTVTPSAAPITLVGDAGRLQQVFWNLLTNAVKFTPRDGRIDVQISQVDSHAEVRVQDNGEGISRDFMPRLFDPFTQAEGGVPQSGQQRGLGLGLAIAHELVAAHGGGIAAESDGVGRGSTFTVTLPLHSPVGSG